MEFQGAVLRLITVVVLVSFASAGYSGGCSKYCPYGQILDSGNCNCVRNRVFADPYPVCPSLNCAAGRFPCRRYKRDINGCNTCQCLDRCYESRCPTSCIYGTEIYSDSTGCQTCRCKLFSFACNSPSRCQYPCSGGYVTDYNGCNTCQCKVSSVAIGCGDYSSCSVDCPYGRVLNTAGCQLCECRPKPLCGPVCDNTCSGGRVLDTYGCPTCQCLLG